MRRGGCCGDRCLRAVCVCCGDVRACGVIGLGWMIVGLRRLRISAFAGMVQVGGQVVMRGMAWDVNYGTKTLLDKRNEMEGLNGQA